MKGKLKENYFSADGALYKDDQVRFTRLIKYQKSFVWKVKMVNYIQFHKIK